MKRILLLTTLFFLAISCLMAQRTVSGKVTDDSGEGLPGVNVVIRGTTTGVTTDIDGNYSIAVNEGDVLVFSYVGFNSQEIEVGSRTSVDVSLSGVTELQEVVVTGLGGEINKSRLSTQVNTVTAKDLANVPVVRVDQLLQSKLPNTQILQSTGQPGGTSVVRSRGVNSAILGQQPVIYIDGIRVDNLNTSPALNVGTGGAQSSALADIPVESIEEINFLKGGAATTLYGSDAANGVLLITTKKGTAGTNTVTYEAQMGAIRGTSDFFVYGDVIKDLAFKTGFLNSHSINMSGGNENVTYNFFGKYRDDNSFLEGLEERRYSIGGGYNATITEKLNYQGSFSYVSNNFNRLPNANTSFDRVFGIDQGLPAGQLGLSSNDPSMWTSEDRTIVSQLISDVANQSNITTRVNRFTNAHRFNWSPVENLEVNFSIGLDYRVSRDQDITTNEYLVTQGFVSEGTTDQGSIERNYRSFLSTSGTASLKYDAFVGDFNFQTIVGGQFFRNIDEQIGVTTTGQAETSQTIGISQEQTVVDFFGSVTNQGYFFQENIGFKDRYFIDFGFRNDFNTAFGSDVTSQLYPKAGVSYLVSNENFFSSVSEVVSQLRLRASWGQAGNFPIPFTRDTQLNANTFLGNLSFQPGQPGFPELGPEILTTTEFGADFGFLDGRISVEATYFSSVTEDALFVAPFAPSNGEENQLRNLGEISNKGWEVALNATVLDNSDWNIAMNVSYNSVENEVTDGGGAPEFNAGGFLFLGSFIAEGQPVGYLRGSRPTFAEDGSLAEVEQNATLGSPVPDAFGSLGINATYKNFSLYVAGDYQVGGSGVNVDEVLRFFRGLQDDRIPEESLDESFFDLAGVWVEDTDFLKIRNITLSYNIPKEFFGNSLPFVKRASIGFTALNPFNFHNSVFDPEITGSGSRATLAGTNTTAQGQVTVGGFGYGTVSAPRQFIGTLRITF